MSHKILVIANRTCPCPELRREIAERAGAHDGHDVLIVAPALNDSRLAHWVSDSDSSVVAARDRLAVAVAALAQDGVTARGEVGDATPATALADSLATFAADEVIIATHPAGRSHWLEQGFADDARERVDVPLTHVQTPYGLDDPV